MGKAALWSACQEQKTKCKNTSSGFLDGLVFILNEKKTRSRYNFLFFPPVRKLGMHIFFF